MKPHWLLMPLAPVYGFGTILRNWFFDIGIFHSVDVGVPVISVGNISAGGTGKTPIVKSVASILLVAGKHVAIISRGYGRSSKGTVIVSDGKNILANADIGGDEPLLLAEQLRNAIVIVDEDRVRGARTAVEEFGATVIVLDDGFQHRYIERRLDIVLIDANESPFDMMLLPAGYRREPESSFKRADAVVVTKSDGVIEASIVLQRDELRSITHKFSSSYQPSEIYHVFGGVRQSLEMLKGHRAISMCGIAKPESFLRSLGKCGVNVVGSFHFSDHHYFTASDVSIVLESFRTTNADFIITTEKDAVRLRGFGKELKHVPILALTMDVTIHQYHDWKKFITSGLN